VGSNTLDLRPSGPRLFKRRPCGFKCRKIKARLSGRIQNKSFCFLQLSDGSNQMRDYFGRNNNCTVSIGMNKIALVYLKAHYPDWLTDRTDMGEPMAWANAASENWKT
jgi:hypothetical protein